MITVIIPVYNKERYLEDTVKSVLKQKCDDVEVMIVDDGSTDGSGRLADKLASCDRRIRVIHQENQWIYAAFNRGIQEARGDYFYILNADDLLEENIIEILNNKVREYNYPDVIWTRCLVCHCDEYRTISNEEMLERGQIEEHFFSQQEEIRKQWIYFVKSNLASNQANLYKTELGRKHPFRNDVYGADVLFNISIADDINSCLVLADTAYRFFLFNNLEENASNGKYYGYEHEMFNECYLGHRGLLEKWGVYGCEEAKDLARLRMKYLSSEIGALFYKNCSLSTELKAVTLLSYADSILQDCAKSLGAEEELEGRIFTGLRRLYCESDISPEQKRYFAYELLDRLTRFEKTKEDIEIIRRAIYHPSNPFHVGARMLCQLEGKTIC